MTKRLILGALWLHIASAQPAELPVLAGKVGAMRDRQSELRQAVRRLRELRDETRRNLETVPESDRELREVLRRNRLRQMQALTGQVARLTGQPGTAPADDLRPILDGISLDAPLPSVSRLNQTNAFTAAASAATSAREAREGMLATVFHPAVTAPQAPPTPADTRETRSIRLTPEIRALASSLRNAPDAIFEFVRKEIAFEPYFGSRIDSQSVLWARRANNADTATLLIALLRASGIAARYGTGTVRIPASVASQWFGYTRPAVTEELASAAFLAQRKGDAYEGLHIWAEAYLNEEWVKFDASFKLGTLQQGTRGPRPAFDRPGYLARRSDALPSDLHLTELVRQLRTQDGSAELKNYRREVHPAASAEPLGYTLLAEGASQSDSAFLAFRVGVTVATNSAPGTPPRTLISATASLPEVAAEGISLAYTQPFPANGSGTPQLRTGTILLGTSLSQVVAGTGMTITVAVTFPGSSNVEFSRGATTVFAGQVVVATLASHQQSELFVARKVEAALASFGNFATDPQRATVDLLALAGARYAQRFEREVRKVADAWQLRLLPGFAIDFTIAGVTAQRAAGRPFVMMPVKLSLDATGIAYSAVDPVADLSPADVRNWHWITQTLGSALEHLLWEEIGFVRSVSTIRGLQQAGDSRIPVLTANRQNVAQLLAGTSLPEGMRQLVRDAIAAPGMTSAIFPNQTISFLEWNGLPGIVEDGATGVGTYLIISSVADVLRGGAAAEGPNGPLPPLGFTNGPGNAGSTNCPNPVSISNGNMFHQFTDLVLTAAPAGPLSLVRTYNSMRTAHGAFGRGWTHNLEWKLSPGPQGNSWTLEGGAGTSISFQRQGNRWLSHVSGGMDGLELFLPASGERVIRSLGGFTWKFDRNGLLAETVSGFGPVLRLEYDSSNRLTAVTHVSGSSIRLTHNASGLIAEATASDGQRIQYEYEGDNLRAAVNSIQARTQFAYYPAAAGGAMQSIRDPEGRTVSFVYYPNGRVWKTINPDSSEMRYYYMPWQNETVVVDEDGIATSYRFNSFGQTTHIVNSDGTMEEFDWDPVSGLLRSTRDLRGAVTSYGYDERNNVVRITDGLGATTTWNWNPTFNIPASMTNALGQTYSWEVDGAGLPRSVRDAAGNVATLAFSPSGQLTEVRGETAQLDYQYDGMGKLANVTDNTGSTMQLRYDASNRLTAIVNPAGGETALEYDVNGNLTTLTDPLGNTSTRRYDRSGNVVEVRPPGGAGTQLVYDAVGNLTRIREAGGLSELGLEYASPACGCSSAGSIRSITDPLGNKTTREWDKQGRILRSRNAEGNETVREYGPQDELLRVVTANGEEIRYEYDLLGRVIRRVLSNGRDESFAYSATGQLIRATNEHSDYTLTYDEADRLVSMDDAVTGLGVRYQYGKSSRLDSFTDPLGRVTRYEYAPGGGLSRLSQDNGLAWGFQYDAAGLLQSIRYPHGGEEKIAFDAAGRLISDGVFRYQHDAAGNVLSISSQNGEATFQYDALDRLAAARYPDGRAETFGYDAAGNRLPGVYDHAHRLLESASAAYTYDAEGNRLTRRDAQGGITRYAYNPDNQLTSVILPDGRTVVYKYDVFGRRIEKSVEGEGVTQFLYDRSAIVTEIHNGDIRARYTPGPGVDHLLAIETQGQTYLVRNDRAGSASALLTVDGTVVETYEYQAFGKPLRPVTASARNRFLFTGREYDAETGLYYFRARYYDPDLGRFLQEDPKWSITDPQTLQQYTYAFNNPLRYRDSSGEWPLNINTGGSHTGGNEDAERRKWLERLKKKAKEKADDLARKAAEAAEIAKQGSPELVEEGSKRVFGAFPESAQLAMQQKSYMEMAARGLAEWAKKNPKATGWLITLGAGSVALLKYPAGVLAAPVNEVDMASQFAAYANGVEMQFDGKGSMDILTNDLGRFLMEARLKDYVFPTSAPENAMNPNAFARLSSTLVWDCKSKRWVREIRLR
jgi:RHS repeat-associated protein